MLLFDGTLQGNTFVGKTRPVQVNGGYTPDNIKLEFAPDGQSVHWYHNDGTREGSGTLNACSNGAASRLPSSRRPDHRRTGRRQRRERHGMAGRGDTLAGCSTQSLNQ